MSGEEFSAADTIDRAYRRADGEVEFGSLFTEADPDNDDVLAELIEADGRWRIARGMAVDLVRYTGAVANLSKRPVPLDAAIDIALRSLSGGSPISEYAVEALIRGHPQWETVIREAATLNAAVLSTTGMRRRIEPLPPKRLPLEFGPVLPSGQRRYVLEQLLGHGAFGHVYLSRDRQLSEEGHAALVAIKILVPADRTPFDRQRLIEEATKVRRVSHPNVVMVLDRGVSDDHEDYIVYEYVDGRDLDDRLGAKPSLWPLREAAALVAKIARGIHAAHSAGVIHCDLKPGNIMMTAAGEPKVTDFGVAIRIGEALGRRDGSSSEAASRHPIGNVAFIAPEQFRGESDAITVQADIFSLGGILFHLLTGVLPSGSTLSEIARHHAAETGQSEPPSLRTHRPEIDPDLECIAMKALARKPQDRYASASALAEDLERWLRLEPLGWNHPSRWHVWRLWIRRKPALAGALGAIVLLSIAGVFTARHYSSLARQRQLEAAVSQARLDEQKLAKAEQDRNRIAIMNKLVTLQKNYRYNTDILPQIWYLEYLLGPKVLDIPEAQSRLWEHRVQTIRWFVNDAREHGRDEAMETLLWESALGFWLVGGGDHAEAEPLLKANLERWRKRLEANDQWLVDIETLRLCAAANRLAATAAAGPVTTVDHGELRTVESALARIDQSMPSDHRGTPLHFLVLDRLIDLHGPKLLNNPGRVEQHTNDKALLLKNK